MFKVAFNTIFQLAFPWPQGSSSSEGFGIVNPYLKLSYEIKI